MVLGKKPPLNRKPSQTKEDYTRLLKEREYLRSKCVIYRQETLVEPFEQSKRRCATHLPMPTQPFTDESLVASKKVVYLTTTLLDKEIIKLASREGYDYERLIHNIENLQNLLNNKNEKGYDDRVKLGMAIKITHPEVAFSVIKNSVGIGHAPLERLKGQLGEWGYDFRKKEHPR